MTDAPTFFGVWDPFWGPWGGPAGALEAPKSPTSSKSCSPHTFLIARCMGCLKSDNDKEEEEDNKDREEEVDNNNNKEDGNIE